MDRIVEEIALVPTVAQNTDDDILNKRKLHRKSDDIQNPREKRHVFNRIFNSNNHLKEFFLCIILFICLLLIAGPLSLHISYILPAVKRRNIGGDIFSEERARDNLNNLSLYGSRVSNTRGNIDARNFLISKIERIDSMKKRRLQFEIDLQNFTDSNDNQLQNIVVRVSNPITKSKNISSLMLSAHYDSVEFSPGASDDGSGVVILLELLSNLVNDLTVSFSDVHLIVLFTNAEESGLQGAKAFITNHTWRSNIRRFINVDAVSCNEVASLIQIKSSQLVVDYSRVSRPRANVILETIPKWIEITMDYDMFTLNNSLKGYDFGFLLDAYTYHTSYDQPSIIKQGVLQDLGDNLGILVRIILGGDFQEIDNSIDNDSLIYFDIFGRYLIVYKMYTSRIIQQILIILIIIISIILIISDHFLHRHKSLSCIDCRCIYFNFKNPFRARITSIIVYFISNVTSGFIGLLFSLIIASIMSIIHPVSWFGNSTLCIFLFSLPCFIGFITIGYLWNSFHNFLLRKSSVTINVQHFDKINFNFEQNLSVLLVYSLLMIVSIVSNNRLFYIILVWSIFICPIYLILMIIEFIIHWKEIHCKRYYWLFLPLIISLFPLIHTIEIVNRLIRILIPFLVRRFSFGWALYGNCLICSVISIPSTFFVLIFLPILQRTKCFGRTLITLFIMFFIIMIISYNRQPFNNIHPNVFYPIHMSKSIYKIENFSNVPFIVPLVSQSSSITILTLDGLALSPVLDQFSAKSGHILHNKQCYSSTNCTFDDTFNRRIAVQEIEIESMKDFMHYTIKVRHVLSYNIRVSTIPFLKFVVRNEMNIPRIETIIDITLNSLLFSFNIDINIGRCDLNDSPFLLLFTRLMTNIVPMGDSQCEAIEDDTTLIFDINT